MYYVKVKKLGSIDISLIIYSHPFNTNNKNHILTYFVNHQVTDNGRSNRTGVMQVNEVKI